MPGKRSLAILFGFILVLCSFWRPIFECSAKFVIKTLLARHQWHLNCDRLEWSGEGFVFHGVVVDATEAFSLVADKAILSLKTKSIEIDEPHLTMYEWKFEDDFPDWKISMQRGTLVEKKIGTVRFSMERAHPDQIARVIFDREGSQFILEAIRENHAVRLFTSWKSFQLTELNRWIEAGRFGGGIGEGSAEILFADGKKEAKVELNLLDASVDFGLWKGDAISGSGTWQGPLALSPDATFRVQIDHAYTQIGETSFEIVEGAMSSFAQLGAKIELKSSFPWALQLRTVFGEEASIEGEMIFQNGSTAKIRQSFWECIDLGPSEIAFLQSLAAPFFPEISQTVLEKGKISAKGVWGDAWRVDRLEGKDISVSQGHWAVGVEKIAIDQEQVLFSGGFFETPFLNGSGWNGTQGKLSGSIGDSEVKINLLEAGFAAFEIEEAQGKVRYFSDGNRLIAKIEEGSFPAWRLNRLTMEWVIEKDRIDCYDLLGEVAEIPFYIPHFSLQGSLWAFDFRVVEPSWDVLRLWGTGNKGAVSFDPAKSHLLGAQLNVDSCLLGKEGVKKLALKMKMPLPSLKMASEILRQKKLIPDGWDLNPLDGIAEIEIDYQRDGPSHIAVMGDSVRWNEHPIDLQMIFDREKTEWKIGVCQMGDIALAGHFGWNKGVLNLSDLQAKIGGVEMGIRGKIEPLFSGAIQLSEFSVDFHDCEKNIDAHLNGKGKIEKKSLDLAVEISDLKIKGEVVESQSLVSIDYFSETGWAITGLALKAPMGSFKTGLLKYDPSRDFWTMNQASIVVSPEISSFFCGSFPFELKQNLEVSGDIECLSDLSFFVCKVKEGLIPMGEDARRIRDLRLTIQEGEAWIDCQWLYEGRPLAVDLHMKWDGPLIESGRLDPNLGINGILALRDEELQHPLVVEWGFQKEKGVSVHRIEGSFDGIEASFYREMNGGLIGSVRFDFSQLKEILPEPLGEKMGALRLGAGYELKGRFSLDQTLGPSFQGILTGKEIELLDYRFRTLFAQVELTQNRIKVTNLKLSDSAGILQIGDLTASQEGNSPWTIQIPKLSIQELRPSLLQKIGENLGPMTPLIIRELKLEDFKGIIGEPATFQAKGDLTFINSYRRMHTVFDLPSDVLGLLVGLDQELLIPTCGNLRFEMNQGRVRFTQLEEAFSQGKRSQFFLVQSEDSPYLNLDGSIHILIKMKQFVLFKFTEFFLISIGGDVSEPQFRLQKKKGIFGL